MSNLTPIQENDLLRRKLRATEARVDYLTERVKYLENLLSEKTQPKSTIETGKLTPITKRPSRLTRTQPEHKNVIFHFAHSIKIDSKGRLFNRVLKAINDSVEDKYNIRFLIYDSIYKVPDLGANDIFFYFHSLGDLCRLDTWFNEIRTESNYVLSKGGNIIFLADCYIERPLSKNQFLIIVDFIDSIVIENSITKENLQRIRDLFINKFR